MLVPGWLEWYRQETHSTERAQLRHLSYHTHFPQACGISVPHGIMRHTATKH